MRFDVLTTVYIGNALGIVLLITLFFSNIWRTGESRDIRSAMNLLIMAGISCIADPIVYTVDGHPGLINTVIIYVGNSWLYIANMLTGKYWVDFIAEHLGISLSNTHKRALDAVFLSGLVLLVANVFYPIVFSVEGNVYRRTYVYWIYVLIAAFYMLDSVVLYWNAKRTGGVLKYFPIGIFVLPVVVGVIVQSLFYGISVVWASVAIGLAGLMTALQNEIIFRDRLTGLYNRTYLDYLQRGIYKQKSAYITGMMIDLNEFKTINDRFGHGTGDEALKTVADILARTVGSLGSVIRYAGDEFVILLNTIDEAQVQTVVTGLQAAFEETNRSGVKPYRLSASLGYSAMDLKNQSMNDFMNTIDRKMYENKAAYYQSKTSADMAEQQ